MPDRALIRIADANANRAREALRVLEDIARFGLDDAAISATIKSARHELSEALARLGLDPLTRLAARDTEADVGTTISTPGEARRANIREIAGAASGRLSEALRSLEECAKAISAPVAPAFEQLRYQSYTLEKDLLLRLPTGRAPQWRLCVLITQSLCIHHPWERIAELALTGGADCLQLREKELTDHELLERARTLVQIASTHNAAVIVNDRPDIALAAEATGVHLGQHDLPPEVARRIVGTAMLIGVSCSTLSQAQRAVRQGADTLGLGPMFPSSTKPKPTLSGVDLLAAVLADEQLAEVPHLAISGINPVNAAMLAEAGCRGIAVSSAVCSSPDPAQACRDLLTPFVTRA